MLMIAPSAAHLYSICFLAAASKPMLHPIYSAVLQRPELLLEHGLAYADLVQAQARGAGRALRSRAWTGAIALIGAVLALVYAGMALMLGLLLERYHPVLWLLPGVCALVALLAAWRARRPVRGWLQLQTELEEDLRAVPLSRLLSAWLHQGGGRRLGTRTTARI